MQILQRWQNILILNNSVKQSARLAAATHFASIHSTNAFCESGKNRPNSEVTRDQESSKTYIRYTVREKRTGAKKDLKGILYNSGCSTSRHEIGGGYADQLNKKSRIKPIHHLKRAAQKKLKSVVYDEELSGSAIAMILFAAILLALASKPHSLLSILCLVHSYKDLKIKKQLESITGKSQRESSFDDHHDNPAKAFFAAFEKFGSSWTFGHREQKCEWTGNSGWSARIDSHDNSSNLGTCADRKILGLPTTGPLKIEDVKAAFRSSALKWHPDRHQGSSRAAAEDKFKHCVDAYNSLCKNLSAR